MLKTTPFLELKAMILTPKRAV